MYLSSSKASLSTPVSQVGNSGDLLKGTHIKSVAEQGTEFRSRTCQASSLTARPCFLSSTRWIQETVPEVKKILQVLLARGENNCTKKWWEKEECGLEGGDLPRKNKE